MDETYKLILEDRRDHFLAMMSLMPMARSAMDEKSSKALSDYAKSVEKMFRSWTPWDNKTPVSDLRRKVKSGTIVVIADASDSPNDPLFKDATVLKG